MAKRGMFTFEDGAIHPAYEGSKNRTWRADFCVVVAQLRPVLLLCESHMSCACLRERSNEQLIN